MNAFAFEILFSSLFVFLLILFPVLLIAREKKIKINSKNFRTIEKELGFNWIGKKELAKKTIFLFACLLAVGLLASHAYSSLGFNDLEKVNEELKSINPALLFYILTIGITAEEVFFRGLLVSKMGIFPASLAFGFAHALYGSIGEILGAFLLGVLLSWFFKRNKTLFPNIFAHMAYNFAILWLPL